MESWNTISHANADELSGLPLPGLPATSTTPAETVLLIESLQDTPITADEIADWTQVKPPIFTSITKMKALHEARSNLVARNRH